MCPRACQPTTAAARSVRCNWGSTRFIRVLSTVLTMNAARTLVRVAPAQHRRAMADLGVVVPASSTAQAPVQVAVIAGDPITGQGVATYLATRPEILVLEADRQQHAQVVLVIVDVISEETFRTMRVLADSADEKPGFVLIGDDLRENQVPRVVSLGMVSVLSRRTADFDQVVQAVLNLRDGRLELPGNAVSWLAERLRNIQRKVLEPNGLCAAGMTEREVEVLAMLADGLDTAEIAKRLNYSERTVKNAIYAVISRLNLRNRAHAVAYAIRNGAI